MAKQEDYQLGMLVSFDSDSPVQFLWLETQYGKERIVFWPTDLGSVGRFSGELLEISVAATSFVAAAQEDESFSVPVEGSHNFVLNLELRGGPEATEISFRVTSRW
jgi:hypothetical protein